MSDPENSPEPGSKAPETRPQPENSIPAVKNDAPSPPAVKTSKRVNAPGTPYAPETPEERFQRREKEAEARRAAREQAKREEIERRRAEHKAKVEADRRAIEEEGDQVEGGESVTDARREFTGTKVPAIYEPPEERAQIEIVRENKSPLTMTWDDAEEFLLHYSRNGMWNQAAYHAGHSPETFRQLEKSSPHFQALVREAKQDFRECMEAEVLRRARDGIVKPVFGKEGVIGYVREYSDRLMEISIKAAWREKYGDTAGGGSLPDGVKFGVLVVPGIVTTPEEWESLHGQAARGIAIPQQPSNILADPAGADGGNDKRLPLPKITRPVTAGR